MSPLGIQQLGEGLVVSLQSAKISKYLRGEARSLRYTKHQSLICLSPPGTLSTVGGICVIFRLGLLQKLKL